MLPVITDSGWSRETAYSLAVASQMAYAKPSEISAAYTAPGVRVRTLTNWRTHIRCFVVASKDTFLLSFRGTNCLDNAITDVRFFRKSWRGAKVHQGILEAYLSIKPQIESALKDLRTSRQRIVVTGHSLGAGLALAMCYDHLGEAFSCDWQCYAFGCPGTGNRAFASDLEVVMGDRLWLVDHEMDIVTHMPLAGLMTGLYVRPRNNMFIDCGGMFHENAPTVQKIPSAIVELARKFPRGIVMEGASDHPIEGYVQALKAV